MSGVQRKGSSSGTGGKGAAAEPAGPAASPRAGAASAQAGAAESSLFRAGLLDGQVAILSGGGSGLGREAALELARCGAKVVICGRRPEPLAETVALDPHGRLEALVCDIREEDEVQRLVERVLDRHGQVDLLVNNAGGQFMAPAEAITPKGFRTVIRLNVEGTWLMTHEVATKAMIPSGKGGKVLSVTLSPHNGMPGMAHSGAARAAVENMMRTLSIEWARFDVKLAALAVGQFATETLLTKYPQAIVERIADTIPLQRLGSEREFAWLVAYLASPAGDFVSGTVVTIDGARDDWLGPWPPPAATDEQGKPLSEDRRGA
jgi:citronellol/citronellal dehydrogenase